MSCDRGGVWLVRIRFEQGFQTFDASGAQFAVVVVDGEGAVVLVFSSSVTRLTVAFCSQEIKKADTARHDTACYDRQGIVVDGSGESHFNRIGIKVLERCRGRH